MLPSLQALLQSPAGKGQRRSGVDGDCHEVARIHRSRTVSLEHPFDVAGTYLVTAFRARLGRCGLVGIVVLSRVLGRPVDRAASA